MYTYIRNKLFKTEYEKEFQRTISVDMRYVFFVMEKLGYANYLFDEMTVIS